MIEFLLLIIAIILFQGFKMLTHNQILILQKLKRSDDNGLL